MVGMNRASIRQAIVKELGSGHLADLASASDLGFAAVLVENHLCDRVPPLRPWQKRAGVPPLLKRDLPDEIRKEFKRLFEQLKTPRKETA